ncbi:MAG TPA: class I SAM-dependent methyltransferase [Gemmataceae bacterium]|nr:class I SAM-dependent methyltransferase [Gemmataceae bacterium]
MKTIGCPLCGGEAARTVVRTDFNLTGSARTCYQVVECRRCRFRYLNPRPDPEELAAFYTPRYPAHALPRPGADGPAAEQVSFRRRLAQVTRHRLALLERFMSLRRTPLRVLDVGCGNGAFLLGLLEQGNVEAWGLDIAAPVLAEVAQRDGRLRLVAGDLHRAALPERYFEVITLWHSLEHDGDPVGVLRRARQLLRPGGLLLAEVPDSAGVIARLCGRYWLGWDLPRHLVHFSAGSLRRAAVQAGLRRIQVLHQYTLNPLCLSPLLASLQLWRRRRKGRMKRVAYHRWDGLGDALLALVNGLERFLGGNGLLLVARATQEERSRCTI